MLQYTKEGAGGGGNKGSNSHTLTTICCQACSYLTITLPMNPNTEN